MKEYVEPDHAENEDEDNAYPHVNNERSSIGYEGEYSENEQDTETVLNQRSAVSLDTESPNSQFPDEQRSGYGLEAVEQAGKSAQKSTLRKRKRHQSTKKTCQPLEKSRQRGARLSQRLTQKFHC